MSALVIFDCDGTLIDSESIANRVLRNLLGAAGWSLELDEVARLFTGRSLRECRSLIESRLGRKLPADFLIHYERDLRDGCERSLAVMPGVENALDRIARPFCVASNSGLDWLAFTLARTGLLPRFAGRIFSAQQVERAKPAPDLFLFAARRLGATAAECVVVEDSLPGVTAGLAAGMRVLGYVPDSLHLEALSGQGIELFSHMDALPDLLESV